MGIVTVDPNLFLKVSYSNKESHIKSNGRAITMHFTVLSLITRSVLTMDFTFYPIVDGGT